MEKKNQIFRIKIDRVKIFFMPKITLGGVLKKKKYSTNFKYMISIWNFFFEKLGKFLLPFLLLHPVIGLNENEAP